MKLKHRIIAISLVGFVLAAGLFYWLYIKPLRKHPPLKLEDPRITESIVTNRERVLLIGAAGLDFRIALALMNQGRMPNLTRLFERGTHGLLKAEPPLVAPAVFTTLVTGQPAAVHALDNSVIKPAFQYREVKADSRFRESPALWRIAEFGGRVAAVVNYPAAAPAEPLEDGVFVAAGIAPGRIDEDAVRPPEWKERAESAPLPRFPAYEEMMQEVQNPRVTLAYDLDRAAFSIALEVMREKRPELLIVGFSSLEFITQLFYKYRFPVSMEHYEELPAQERARYRPILEMHYELLDRMIGGLLGEAEGYTVVLVSGYGFGPAYPPENIHLDLNLLLERMGRLMFEGPTCDQLLMQMVKTGELKLSGPLPASAAVFMLCQELKVETEKALAEGASRMHPAELAALIAVKMELAMPRTEAEEERQWDRMDLLSLRLRPHQQRSVVSWEHTTAFSVNDHSKPRRGIYLNLEGREPRGVVKQEEFKKERKRLVRELRSLRTEHGDPLFFEVKPNPAKKGPYSMTLADQPDIVVRINREALIQDYAYRKPGERDPLPLAAVRMIFSDLTALPSPEGFYLISGPQSKTFNRVDIETLDLTPTLLWFLGLPVGADMQGEARKELFDQPASKRPVYYIGNWDQVFKRPSE